MNGTHPEHPCVRWLDPHRPGRRVDLYGSRLTSDGQLADLMAFLHPWDDEISLKFSLEASTGSAVSVTRSRPTHGDGHYVVRPLGRSVARDDLFEGYIRMREDTRHAEEPPARRAAAGSRRRSA